MQYYLLAWVSLFIFGLYLYFKLRISSNVLMQSVTKDEYDVNQTKALHQNPGSPAISSSPHLVHRLCPHNKVVQSFEVERKDSLDEHLDSLAQKLAKKEGKLLISKSKLRQTQNEIDNLHAIDNDVRSSYKSIMDTLRQELHENEKDCKALQQQIEWVSRRRAELQEEVVQNQKEFSEAQSQFMNIQKLTSSDPIYQYSQNRDLPFMVKTSQVVGFAKAGSSGRCSSSAQYSEHGHHHHSHHHHKIATD